MPTPKPIEAVIKKVVANPGGKSWDVFLVPYEDLWLTVHADETGDLIEPKVGDILKLMPPQVLNLRRPIVGGYRDSNPQA